MKSQTIHCISGFSSRPLLHQDKRCHLSSPTSSNRHLTCRHNFRPSRRCISARYSDDSVESYEHEGRSKNISARRRDVITVPFVAIGAYFLRGAVAKSEELPTQSVPDHRNVTVVANTDSPAPDQQQQQQQQPQAPVVKVEEKKEEVINSRIYDATAIGEPMALGKDKSKVWEKLMNARVVYLGEAEQVPVRDDKELELEIVKSLQRRCTEIDRPLSLALEAFPCNLQEQLNKYMAKTY